MFLNFFYNLRKMNISVTFLLIFFFGFKKQQNCHFKDDKNLDTVPSTKRTWPFLRQ